MVRLGLSVVAAMTIAVGAACGGGTTSSSLPSVTPSPAVSTTASPSPNPSLTCSPNGTELEIIAQSTGAVHAFDRSCLAAPADTPFTIRFDNRDADAHNVDILDHPGGTPLFTGKIVTG